MRRRWPLLLLVAGLVAAAGVAVLYLAGGAWVARLTRARLPELIEASRRGGGELRRVEFTQAEVVPWATLRWSPVAAEAVPPPSRRQPQPKPVRVRAVAVTARLRGVWPLRAELEIDGIRIDAAVSLSAPEDVPFGEDDLDVPLDRIDNGSILIPDIALSSDLRGVAKSEIEALRHFFQEGSSSRPITLSARLHFRLRGVPMTVRIETLHQNGQSHLRINRSDLDVLSGRYYRPLTPAEKDLIARHPVKAPVLLRIKDYAERNARRLASLDSAYREDPTRHVLWSYWLARTYGPTFAEEVTEAHEIGSSNSTRESDRDRANNHLGREYAAAKKTEGQVVHLIKTDTRVAR